MHKNLKKNLKIRDLQKIALKKRALKKKASKNFWKSFEIMVCQTTINSLDFLTIEKIYEIVMNPEYFLSSSDSIKIRIDTNKQDYIHQCENFVLPKMKSMLEKNNFFKGEALVNPRPEDDYVKHFFNEINFALSTASNTGEMVHAEEEKEVNLPNDFKNQCVSDHEKKNIEQVDNLVDDLITENKTLKEKLQSLKNEIEFLNMQLNSRNKDFSSQFLYGNFDHQSDYGQ